MLQEIKDLYNSKKQRSIKQLFEDTNRTKDFSIKFCDLLFDFSKTNIDLKTRKLLIELTRNCNLYEKMEEMFCGCKINKTENRAVLHTALRAIEKKSIFVEQINVMSEVIRSHSLMKCFVEKVRSGAFKGQGGQITDVVNIGIGGSDLGPAMAARALSPYQSGPKCHFVSNIDGAHMADALRYLNPRTTLIIVASKTFKTVETMTNARTALDWMADKVTFPGDQFVAISSSVDNALEFGVSKQNIFRFEDWVGGRFSVWGPIGLALMVAIGPKNFQLFLEGANSIDKHFRSAAPEKNIPIMLALVGFWHNQVCGYQTRAVLPYEQRLCRLPAYLQQLEMESNGKGVTLDGKKLEMASVPVVWGEPGTNGQHAFFQLLHQGNQIVPCEFLVAASGHEQNLSHHHNLLVANCFAQSRALMLGRSISEAREIAAAEGFRNGELEQQAKHRFSPGNRPSTTLLYPKLTPKVLGQIIAIYEHRVFVEGAILGVNSFDQWGVELGKDIASSITKFVNSVTKIENLDSSTEQLIEYIRRHKE